MKSWIFYVIFLMISTPAFSGAHRKNLKVLIDYLQPVLVNVSIKKIEWRHPERYVIDAEFMKGSRGRRGLGAIPPQPCQMLIKGQYSSRKKMMEYRVENNTCK